jgi:hypothetical protein
MAQLDPNNYAQTEANQLTAIANVERKKLEAKNDYQDTIDEYSVVHPDALADGDEMGRGTGIFLDIFNENGGTSIDIVERKLEIKFNKYNKNKTYPDF